MHPHGLRGASLPGAGVRDPSVHDRVDLPCKVIEGQVAAAMEPPAADLPAYALAAPSLMAGRKPEPLAVLAPGVSWTECEPKKSNRACSCEPRQSLSLRYTTRVLPG